VVERIVEIERARAAADGGSWADAYASFRELDPSEFAPEDWERFADAAWCLGRIEESRPLDVPVAT
jgi:hypothetical protein